MNGFRLYGWNDKDNMREQQEQREQVDILGIKINSVTMEEALQRVAEMIGDGGKHQVVTPNPEHVVMAQEDQEFRDVLNAADLAIPDGVGLVWASKLRKIFNFRASIFSERHSGQNKVLKERVTGTDLMVNLCRQAAEEGWKVFFLGAEQGVAQEVAVRLREKFPGLQVSGVSSADPNLPIMDYRLRITDSDLLFVAYGAPTQEKWIAKNLHQLPVKVAIGIGGAFDFVVSKQKRAPRILCWLGLEWLWRLVTQPWRWRRQTRLFCFVRLVISDVLKWRHGRS